MNTDKVSFDRDLFHGLLFLLRTVCFLIFKLFQAIFQLITKKVLTFSIKRFILDYVKIKDRG